MQILGDANATLKDLTILYEAEAIEAAPPLYPEICSEVESADEAYIKIPIQSRTAFPTVFDGEGEPESTEVTVVQEYDKSTYLNRLVFGSDLMREAKAYRFADKVADAAVTGKIFPSYNLTKNVIIANGTAYDGNAFYGSTHKYAKAGTNNINNTVSATGQTPTALWNDLQSAVAAMMTFLDDKGKILNPMLRYGDDQLVIHCPVALMAPFYQLLHLSVLPITVPVTNSGTAAATASGPVTIQQLRGIAKLVPDGYLDAASTTAWYLHYVGARQRPFVYAESFGLQSVALGFGTEFEARYNKVMIQAKQRFVTGLYRFDRSIKIS